MQKIRAGFRARLSALFTQIRIQKLGWNEAQAQKAAGLSNTAQAAVEDPGGNPKLDTVTTYARALGYEPEDFFASAAHPESEDAFGHPDVQQFIRVWKTATPAQRAFVMENVVFVDRQLQARAEDVVAAGRGPDSPSTGGRTPSSTPKVRSKG